MTCPCKCYEHNEKKKCNFFLKLWAIIQYYSAVDSQGEVKLNQIKKKTPKNTDFSISGENFLKIFLFNMWNYLEKHSIVKLKRVLVQYVKMNELFQPLD